MHLLIFHYFYVYVNENEILLEYCYNRIFYVMERNDDEFFYIFSIHYY